MMEYITQNLWLFWTVIMFICLILELSSGDFYVTCFAIGALVSILAAVVEAPFWLQVVVWAVCSVLSIQLIRPHLVKAIRKGADERKSNTDALSGQIGGYGRVKLDGDDWKAEAPHSSHDIAVGTRIRVVGHQSIILQVEEY